MLKKIRPTWACRYEVRVRVIHGVGQDVFVGVVPQASVKLNILAYG